VTEGEGNIYRPYAYEVNLDCTAKGYIQPSVKIRSDDLNCQCESGIHGIAIDLLDRLVNGLRNAGYKVATDIEEIPKNGKD
jgi:hypothetical protein